jgi:hypothetical protein
MAIKVVPKYPVVAKNAAWQKQKSFRDKFKKVTKTGLGTQLETAERAFAKIDFNKLDAKRLQKATGKPLTSYVGVDGAKRAAQQHLDGPVRAAHTAVELAVNKASTVSSELRKLAAAIDPDTISLDDFDAVKKQLDALSERSRITVRRLFPALRRAAETAEDLPTVVGYTASGLHEQVLAVNAALNKSDDLTLKVWGKQNWAVLAQPAFLPRQDAAVMKKIKQVMDTLKELEQLVD